MRKLFPPIFKDDILPTSEEDRLSTEKAKGDYVLSSVFSVPKIIYRTEIDLVIRMITSVSKECTPARSVSFLQNVVFDIHVSPSMQCAMTTIHCSSTRDTIDEQVAASYEFRYRARP